MQREVIMSEPVYHALRDTITIKSVAKDNSYVFFEVLNPQGSGPPPHMHDWEEVMYVLDGSLDVMIDGIVTTVTAGMNCSIPSGALHSFKGGAPNGSRFLTFAAPAGIEHFFADLDREIGVPNGPPDVAKVKEISARHGYRWP